jgi:hypothetical protein
VNLVDITAKLEEAAEQNAVQLERAEINLYGLQEREQTLQELQGMLSMLARVEKALGPDFELTLAEGSDDFDRWELEGDIVHKLTGRVCYYSTYDEATIQVCFPAKSLEQDQGAEGDTEAEFDVGSETGDLSALVERINVYINGQDMPGAAE